MVPDGNDEADTAPSMNSTTATRVRLAELVTTAGAPLAGEVEPRRTTGRTVAAASGRDRIPTRARRGPALRQAVLKMAGVTPPPEPAEPTRGERIKREAAGCGVRAPIGAAESSLVGHVRGRGRAGGL